MHLVRRGMEVQDKVGGETQRGVKIRNKNDCRRGARSGRAWRNGELRRLLKT